MVAEGRANIGITAADPNDGRATTTSRSSTCSTTRSSSRSPQSHPWYAAQADPASGSLLSTPLITRDPEAHDRRCVEAVLAERGLHLAPPLIEVGSTAVAKREALERRAPVLLSALALDEARDRLYRKPLEGLSFPRQFVIVCRVPSSLPRGRPRFPRLPAARRGGSRGDA